MTAATSFPVVGLVLATTANGKGLRRPKLRQREQRSSRGSWKKVKAQAQRITNETSPDVEIYQVSEECQVEQYYGNVTESFSAGLDAQELDDLLHKLVNNHTVVDDKSQVDTWAALQDLDAFGGSPQSGKVMLLYKQVPVDASQFRTANGWIQHKLIPSSVGVGSSGPDTWDLFNLRAADETVSKARGNKYFDWCKSKLCTMPATDETPPDTGSDSERFMPPVGVRGDIARSIFYMVTRYNGGLELNTEDLQLTDCPSNSSPLMGKLSTLLEWHSADPPDALERRRNDLICSKYQGNRNPFVDFPELIGKIYCNYTDPVENCVNGLIPPVCGGTCSDIGGLVYEDSNEQVSCDKLVSEGYCEFSLIVRERCRASCKMCSSPICQDSEPSGLVWDDNGEDAHCYEVKEFCDLSFVLDSCPATCGACSNITDLPVPPGIDPEEPSTPAVPLPAGNEKDLTFVFIMIFVAGFAVFVAGVASLTVLRRRSLVLEREKRRAEAERGSSVALSSSNPQFRSRSGTL